MKKSVVILTCVFAVFYACKKDAPKQAVEVFKTTPYPFPEISHFRPFVDDPENPLTVEGVDLGHHLFFDTRLSKDYTISCASCHEPEHAYSDPNRVSVGVGGEVGTRHSMSLLNLAWSKQFLWDGRAATLREQALDPVTNPVEMNNTWEVVEQRIQAVPAYVEKFKKAFNTEVVTTDLITKAIEQYVKTLVVYNSDYDKYLRGEKQLSEAAMQGMKHFNNETADCFHCHTTPELVVHPAKTFMNNGMYLEDDFTDLGVGGVTGDSRDFAKFKIPSLRNVEFKAPYMHDGRFATLDDVLDFYDKGPTLSSTIEPIMIAEANRRVVQFNHWGLNMTEQVRSEVIEFLKSLSDTSYLSNPHYLEPKAL